MELGRQLSRYKFSVQPAAGEVVSVGLESQFSAAEKVPTLHLPPELWRTSGVLGGLRSAEEPTWPKEKKKCFRCVCLCDCGGRG